MLSASSNLQLPLEHRLWSKDELRLYVMSDGVCRPLGCSIQCQSALAFATQTPEQIDGAFEIAAGWLRQADAILVGSGAGMGVNSGLATFRGGEGGVWPALEKLDMAYEEICDTRWFEEDPRLAWGFWSFCQRAYHKAKPHEGYDIVGRWAKRAVAGAFSFTSNIDNHWAKSGFPDNRILECHGALRWLQCSAPCCEELWETPEDLLLKEDPKTHRVIGDLPVCPRCQAVARPCVMMFGGDEGFSVQGRRKQHRLYKAWFRNVARALKLSPEPLLVCLEIGSGITVPTVRKELESAVKRHPSARLIRINPENPGVDRQWEDRAVSLPIGAAEALRRLDGLLQVNPSPGWAGPPGVVIVHDEHGGGVELHLPRDTPWHQIARRALLEVRWEPDTDGYGSGAPAGRSLPVGIGRHVLHRTDQLLEPQDRVNEAIFFPCDGADAPPLAEVVVTGGRLMGRNDIVDARAARVFRLLDDVGRAFQDPAYQEGLAKAQDQDDLKQLIRTVHNETLPKDMFKVSMSSSNGEWMLEQSRMQAYIQSANWIPDLRYESDRLQEASGAWRKHGLPRRKPVSKCKQQANGKSVS